MVIKNKNESNRTKLLLKAMLFLSLHCYSFNIHLPDHEISYKLRYGYVEIFKNKVQHYIDVS